MKNEVLITVSYVVEIENDDFWMQGKLQPRIKEVLKKQFPKKFKINENCYAKQEKLMHISIDRIPNIQKCPSCGKLMFDTSKPHPILLPLRTSKELAGTLYCEGCEWELRIDHTMSKGD